MKPRLKSLPLTDEDFWIWWNRRPQWARPKVLGDGYHGKLAEHSIDSDRRDADLMFALERCRARERAETVDGKPLSVRAYAHSLLDASQLFEIVCDDEMCNAVSPFNIT